MTLNELRVQMNQMLEKAGVPDADVDALRLLEYVTGMGRAMLIAYGTQEADEEQAGHALELSRQRARRIPLQHLTGEQAFMNLSFAVSKDVLVPRFDTEILVEIALEKLLSDAEGDEAQEHRQILDIGCGSGCILISLLYELNQNSRTSGKWRGTGVDISDAALETARQNVDRYHLSDCIRLLKSDLFAQLGDEQYSLIVSNPPYIPTDVIPALQPEVSRHDPVCALDGGSDGLDFYRRIVPGACSFLTDGGWLMVEIGYDQADRVRSLFEQAGYHEISVRRDLAGLDRVIMGQI